MYYIIAERDGMDNWYRTENGAWTITFYNSDPHKSYEDANSALIAVKDLRERFPNFKRTMSVQYTNFFI